MSGDLVELKLAKERAKNYALQAEIERLRAALRSIAAGTSAIPIETARAALSGKGES